MSEGFWILWPGPEGCSQLGLRQRLSPRWPFSGSAGREHRVVGIGWETSRVHFSPST